MPMMIRSSTPQQMPNQYPPAVLPDKNLFYQTFSPPTNIQPFPRQEFYQTNPVNMTTITRKPKSQFRKEYI